MANEIERDLPAQMTSNAITPMQMIQIAVSKGTDMAQLEKLMDLQMRYEANEARKAYVAAMSAFKANPPEIVKDKSVSFGAGKTSYKHARLDNASEQIGHALSEHGISHRWEVDQKEGGIINVSCILTHNMGHSERVSMQATPDTSGSKNSIQAIGSTVSYLQRYTLFAATGLAPKGADDDGGGGERIMSETQKADFLAAIDVLTSVEDAKALWTTIAEVSSKIGDIAAYDALKAAMLAKRKGLQ